MSALAGVILLAGRILFAGMFAYAARGHIAAGIDFDPYTTRRWEQLIDAWLPIEFATNSMNRSMGLTDLYPFVLSPKGDRKAGLRACPDATEPAQGIVAPRPLD